MWGQILMIILPRCWVCIFDTEKVPEMRNIGLASIEAVWPQLGQTSSVPHKTTLHAKFQVISSIGGHFTAPPCPRIWTLLPPPFYLIKKVRKVWIYTSQVFKTKLLLFMILHHFWELWKWPFILQPSIYQLQIDGKSKVMTVLRSWKWADFQSVPTFWSRSRRNSLKKCILGKFNLIIIVWYLL